MQYTRDDARRAIERQIEQYGCAKSDWLVGFEDLVRANNLLPAFVDLHTIYFVSPFP